jgi:hypothetical protein
MPPIPRRFKPPTPRPKPLERPVTAEGAQTAITPPQPPVVPLRAVSGPCRACNGTGLASNGGACYPCSLRGTP